MKRKKTNSTLNMAKFCYFINLAESTNMGITRPLLKFYLYLEFQNSILDGVRPVGKITLLDTTSMKGPSLNFVVFRSKFPRK